MNDLELAEEIERYLAKTPRSTMVLGYDPPIWQQIIAALRRGPERPPSGEMVMVPMPDAVVAVGAQSMQLSYFGGNRNEAIRASEVLRRRSLEGSQMTRPAAEAEGRKS